MLSISVLCFVAAQLHVANVVKDVVPVVAVLLQGGFLTTCNCEMKSDTSRTSMRFNILIDAIQRRRIIIRHTLHASSGQHLLNSDLSLFFFAILKR